jgi:hypothetical protein
VTGQPLLRRTRNILCIRKGPWEAPCIRAREPLAAILASALLRIAFYHAVAAIERRVVRWQPAG